MNATVKMALITHASLSQRLFCWRRLQRASRDICSCKRNGGPELACRWHQTSPCGEVVLLVEEWWLLGRMDVTRAHVQGVNMHVSWVSLESQAPQTWPPRMERGEAMAALVLTLGEGVERFRLTPDGARGFTVEGLRAIWKVRCVGLRPHRAAKRALTMASAKIDRTCPLRILVLVAVLVSCILCPQENSRAQAPWLLSTSAWP